MMRKLYCCILLFTISFINLFSLVIQAPNLGVVNEGLQDIDERTLIVWDVDYTLITPADALLSPAGEAFRKEFNKRYASEEFREFYEDRMSRVVSQRKIRLVEEQVLALLQTLKNKGAKVMALTAIRTGKFGVVPNVEDWRVQELRNLGIDFSESFTNEKLVFDEFSGKISPPVFTKGVLCSDSYSKGQVLAAFLKRVNFTPSKILFIDDRMEYIEAVEREFSDRAIVSFHYTAALDQLPRFDEALAGFQLNYLLEHGQWLSDTEARLKMNVGATNPHGTFSSPAL